MTPLGSEIPRSVDLRLLAASHVDLAGAVRDGRFREDLFFRLHVIPLRLPPLRERREDLDLLADAILGELAGGRAERWRLDREARAWLSTEDWPGNIRQLRNVLERATIFSVDGWISRSLLEGTPLPEPHAVPVRPAVPIVAGPGATFREWERQFLTLVLEQCAGRIYGDKGAAARLDLKPTTLQSRLKKLGVRPLKPPAA